MKDFCFRLQKVLDWQQRQVEVERNRARDCYIALLNLQQGIARLESTRLIVHRELVAQKTISSQALASLEQYRARTAKELSDLTADRDRCARALSEQHRSLAAAQRKLRLLENLRARRLEEHTYLANREIEDLASESFLAKWNATGMARPAPRHHTAEI